jgi:hypothetical protein
VDLPLNGYDILWVINIVERLPKLLVAAHDVNLSKAHNECLYSVHMYTVVVKSIGNFNYALSIVGVTCKHIERFHFNRQRVVDILVLFSGKSIETGPVAPGAEFSYVSKSIPITLDRHLIPEIIPILYVTIHIPFF